VLPEEHLRDVVAVLLDRRVDDREPLVRELARDIRHRIRLVEGEPDYQLVALRGELVVEVLVLPVVLRFALVEVDVEVLGGLLEPALGVVAEPLVAQPGDRVDDGDLRPAVTAETPGEPGYCSRTDPLQNASP